MCSFVPGIFVPDGAHAHRWMLASVSDLRSCFGHSGEGWVSMDATLISTRCWPVCFSLQLWLQRMYDLCMHIPCLSCVHMSSLLTRWECVGVVRRGQCIPEVWLGDFM